MSEQMQKKPLGFYINHISHSLRYDAEQKLIDFGITAPQGRLLRIITESLKSNHEINRKYLQEAMYLSGPSVSNLLDGLEKKHYIRRNTSKEDGRALDITVMEKGMALMDKVAVVFSKQEQQLLSGMTGEEVAVLRSLLERAYRNIQE